MSETLARVKNALFPEEGWYARAKAAYTGMGATPNQLFGPLGDTQFVSSSEGKPFVDMATAKRAERLKAAKEQGETLLGFVGGLRGYHGSPHKFDRFDLSKIGTGEGAQVFGHGAYIAENENVAKYYRDILANGFWQHSNDPRRHAYHKWRNAGGNAEQVIRSMEKAAADAPDEYTRNWYKSIADAVQNKDFVRPSKGYMYEVDINAKPNQLLDWDKPFTGQSSYVQGNIGDFVEQKIASMNAAREKMRPKILERLRQGLPLSERERAVLVDATPESITGKKIYQMQEVAQGAMRPGEKGAETAEYFRQRGIPGTQYFDANSRTAGQGSRNYVIFDDNLIDILRRYGTLGPVGAGVVNNLMGTGDEPR